MAMMMRALAVLGLALASTTSASAFFPGSAVKNVAAKAQQHVARLPLVNK